MIENRIQEIEYENKNARPGSVEKVDMFYTGLYDNIKDKNDTVELNIRAFQEIIKRIITDESKGTLKEIILKEEKRDRNDKIKNVIKKTHNLLKKNYRGDNYESRISAGEWKLFDIPIRGAKGTKFLNEVCSKNNIAYSIIYNKKFDKLGTYSSKISVLEKIESKEYNIDYL